MITNADVLQDLDDCFSMPDEYCSLHGDDEEDGPDQPGQTLNHQEWPDMRLVQSLLQAEEEEISFRADIIQTLKRLQPPAKIACIGEIGVGKTALIATCTALLAPTQYSRFGQAEVTRAARYVRACITWCFCATRKAELRLW